MTVSQDPGKEADGWSRWVLDRAFAGDPAVRAQRLPFLTRIRDRVLDGACLEEGHRVLDVGAGDGLIGFGALARVGASGSVTFSDVSNPLLERCREVAAEDGVLGRCAFVRAQAETLDGLPDASFDAVTVRSVLIYVKDKASAFRACRRVLRPGGRLSLFEPINRFARDDRPGRFGGFDAEPVADLARRIRAVYERVQDPTEDPMLDFDERDLIRLATDAGFTEVHLRLEIDVEPSEPQAWETFVRSAPNPLVPTLEEAMGEALTAEETARFEASLRPLVERGQGERRAAGAFLTAT